MENFLQWESIVFAMVSFAILYWLLNKYAFGPLFSIMEKRRERVLGEMESAEKSRQEAEKYLEEQKQAIQEARQEALQIIEQAKKSASRQAEETLMQANAEAERLKAEALQEIEVQKNNAVAELRSQVSAMSVLIASKIVEKQIEEQDHKQLIDQYLQEVGDVQ